ncbi:hypothetical protein [Limnobacter parvus]|uniref:Uncharacterized protein n=1 Tax=Limnobacter parvus TaxID=2939690 RepID=A0ABT1XIY3_9BURK|nr:hypothetical protein [Limnobacter parvus]MCR2747232.1 hypothetical protein [Limnobacter parvus]
MFLSDAKGLSDHLNHDFEEYDRAKDIAAINKSFSQVSAGNTLSADLTLFSVNLLRSTYPAEQLTAMAEEVTPIEMEVKQLVNNLTGANSSDKDTAYKISSHSLQGIQAMVQKNGKDGVMSDLILSKIANDNLTEIELSPKEAQNLAVVLRENLSNLILAKFTSEALMGTIRTHKEQTTSTIKQFEDTVSGQFSILR